MRLTDPRAIELMRGMLPHTVQATVHHVSRTRPFERVTYEPIAEWVTGCAQAIVWR